MIRPFHALAILATLGLAACSSPSNSPKGALAQAKVGNTDVLVRNFDFPGTPKLPGFTNAIITMTGGNTLSREQSINLADQVIKLNPDCSWNGFDDAFDRATRARGQLASIKDTRIIFARVNCS